MTPTTGRPSSGALSAALRRGVVPLFGHGAYEYVLALLLVASSYLFGFTDAASAALTIAPGLAVLALTVLSDLPTGRVRLLPLRAHVAGDLAAGVLLVVLALVAVLGADARGAAVVLLVAAAVHLAVTLLTRYPTATRAR